MKYLPSLLACSLLWLSSFALAAAESPSRVTPAIAGYGGVVDLPDAAVQLDPAKQYKLLFDITQPGQDAEAPLAGLEAAARFVNLAALAGVPAQNLQLVLVFHGAGTSHALADEHYRQRFATANPSLELIDRLVAYGVEVYVCGQALAGMGFGHQEVNPQVRVAVAALTVLANYQLDGYALFTY